MYIWKNPILNEFSRFLGSEPVSAIQEECRELLEKTGAILYENSKYKATNIDKIAKYLGLKDDNYLYGNIASKAYLELINEGTLKIRLSKSSKDKPNLYRYRFIIAHEIGHVIIRNKIHKKFTDQEIDKINKYQFEEEILCQHAASELLMPSEQIIPFLEKISLDKIVHLSKKFQTSTVSIMNRISFLKENRKYIESYAWCLLFYTILFLILSNPL